MPLQSQRGEPILQAFKLTRVPSEATSDITPTDANKIPQQRENSSTDHE